MEAMDIPKAVKEAVQRVDPGATVILYGSRARGDARPDSDWDFIVLIDGPAGGSQEDTVRGAIYEIEWKTGQVLTVILHSRADWDTPVYQATPFQRNVAREGVTL